MVTPHLFSEIYDYAIYLISDGVFSLGKITTGLVKLNIQWVNCSD